MVKTVKSILYLVENKTRDLDAILYFAKEILGKKNNLKVHIMPISRINFNRY